jgi:uncharacterized membrane protein required for colicin V production
MDIGGALRGAPIADLALLVVLGVFFFLGVMQGSIRRLLGMGSMLFAFVISANLRDPVGRFFADNWRQFNQDYNKLIAFVLVFVVLTVVCSIVIQGFYKRTEISARHPIVDDIVGGLLGLLQGFMLVLFAVIILNSSTLPTPRSGDLTQLRDLQTAIVSQSHIANWVRESIAPVFVHILAILLPDDLVKLFP